MAYDGVEPRYLARIVRDYSPEQEVQFLRDELHATMQLYQLELNRNRDLDKTNKLLSEKVYKDPLTGCFNRRFLQEHGPAILESAGSKSRSANSTIVVRFDVNDMKGVNDHEGLGHAGGDKLLQTISDNVAAKLKNYFKRDSDKILIRDGGDEFVVLLPNCTPEYVDASFKEINRTTSFVLNDLQVDVKCAYGYSVYNGQGIEAVLAEADTALYKNKTLKAQEGLRTTVKEMPLGPAPKPA